MDNDLHIITWVRNPSTSNNPEPVGITDDIVQEALSHEESQSKFQEQLGDDFEYSVMPMGTTALPPTEGLEVWVIATIVSGSVLLLIILAMLFECRYGTMD